MSAGREPVGQGVDRSTMAFIAVEHGDVPAQSPVICRHSQRSPSHKCLHGSCIVFAISHAGSKTRKGAPQSFRCCSCMLDLRVCR